MTITLKYQTRCTKYNNASYMRERERERERGEREREGERERGGRERVDCEIKSSGDNPNSIFINKLFHYNA